MIAATQAADADVIFSVPSVIEVRAPAYVRVMFKHI
jgi:hypothetical protein